MPRALVPQTLKMRPASRKRRSLERLERQIQRLERQIQRQLRQTPQTLALKRQHHWLELRLELRRILRRLV